MESNTHQAAEMVEAAVAAEKRATGAAAGPDSAIEPTSSLTIKGQGLTFEREIPQRLVLSIMRLALTGDVSDEPRAGGAEPRRDGEGAAGRRDSLVEFYRRAGPKSYPEKLATIAKYLHDVMGKASFGADDLRVQFRSVNEPAPANISRDMRVAQGEGFIAEEHDAPGQYYITRTGMEAVAAGFGGDGKKAAKRRRKRTPKVGEAVSEEEGEE